MFRITNHIYNLPPSFKEREDKYVPDTMLELDTMIGEYFNRMNSTTNPCNEIVLPYTEGYFLGTDNWIVKYIDLNTLTHDMRNKKIDSICK